MSYIKIHPRYTYHERNRLKDIRTKKKRLSSLFVWSNLPSCLCNERCTKIHLCMSSIRISTRFWQDWGVCNSYITLGSTALHKQREERQTITQRERERHVNQGERRGWTSWGMMIHPSVWMRHWQPGEAEREKEAPIGPVERRKLERERCICWFVIARINTEYT